MQLHRIKLYINHEILGYAIFFLEPTRTHTKLGENQQTGSGTVSPVRSPTIYIWEASPGDGWGPWVQGKNPQIKLGWQQTVAPGDAFVEQTSNFWILFMIACLFGHSDVFGQFFVVNFSSAAFLAVVS